MLSNEYMIRDLAPDLLNDFNKPTNKRIRNRILEADSKIYLWLASRYAAPPKPSKYLDGLITIDKSSKIIEGIGTSFSSLLPGNFIQVVKTAEVLQIDTIEDDLLINSETEAFYSCENSEFWILPDELVTVSKYLSAHLVIMLEFPEKTLKQDNVEKFDRRMEFFAGDLIKKLENGDYLNTDLLLQSASKNRASQIKIFKNCTNESTSEFISNVLKF